MRELIAVTERLSPNTECYLHGNLPVQSSPFAEENESASEMFATQKRVEKKETVVTLDLKTYKTTRVDVDLNGRRSLVNEMR